MSDLTAKLFVLAQRALPKQFITNLIYRIARIRVTLIKNFLIRMFVTAYKVNTVEVKLAVPGDFESFNAFFTRELSAGARPIDAAQYSIASPVDGTVSSAGKIVKERLYQAKGIDYSLTELLATDVQDAEKYADGAFATIYLAPYNYHRVHAPLAGFVETVRYIPGKLFSVNEATVAQLPGLFVQNERLVCHLRTDVGPMLLIFIGAMNVGSISTRWTGEIRPQGTGVVEQMSLQKNDSDIQFNKGDMLGWFNMGSTVILLHPPNTTMDFEDLEAGQIVRVGEVLGRTVAW